MEMMHKAMKSTRQQEGLALFPQSELAPPEIISEADLAGLPDVVQRYLRYAGVVGKAPIRTVHLTQHGVMRQHPGQTWMPLVAEHSVTTAPAAFLWQCTMRPFPFVWLSATDRLTGGQGSMRIKLLSCITVAQAHGPEIDQAELQRYLAEMMWYPTAWLTDAIEWQAIDDSSVCATLRVAGVTGSVVLHVNAQGQLTQITADRYKEDHGRYQLTPWSGQCDAYQDIEGMRIPTKIEVTWQLASGTFTWLRLTIIAIAYNQWGALAQCSETASPDPASPGSLNEGHV